MGKCACGASLPHKIISYMTSEYHTKDQCYVQRWITIKREENNDAK
jgi:hypothetical protein